jgi:hypothetical protein
MCMPRACHRRPCFESAARLRPPGGRIQRSRGGRVPVRWSLVAALLAAIAVPTSAHAQDIDLVCNPFAGDEDSIKRNNLHIHIHLGDKPQMTFWDGTQPDFVSPSASEIYFRWDAKRADGQHHDGNINRVTGKTAVWAYDHFEIAECLPVKRLF